MTPPTPLALVLVTVIDLSFSYRCSTWFKLSTLHGSLLSYPTTLSCNTVPQHGLTIRLCPIVSLPLSPYPATISRAPSDRAHSCVTLEPGAYPLTTDESTKTLQLTQSLYDNYTSLLTTSTHLVKALERADWYDRLLILAAFILFLVVVGWVLKRRVLDKVVGGVGWWVGGSWRLLRMGVGSKTKTKAAELGAVGTVETVRMVRASGASAASAASLATVVTKAGSAALESAAGEAAAQARSMAKEVAGAAGAAAAAASGMASAASSVVSGNVRDLDKEGRKVKPAADNIIDEILPSVPAAGSESATASPIAVRDEL